MTDDWREERLQTVAAVLGRIGTRWPESLAAGAALDAADAAVPVVPLERAEKAEAAARDLADVLRVLADGTGWVGDPMRQGSWLHGHFTPFELARDALARHPEYAPESHEATR